MGLMWLRRRSYVFSLGLSKCRGKQAPNTVPEVVGLTIVS